MGYSTPKKQLDLKEFLSQPAKSRNKRTFRKRFKPAPPTQTEKTGDETAKDLETG